MLDIKAAIERYIGRQEARNLSKRTIQGLRSWLGRLAEFLIQRGKRSVALVEFSDLERWQVSQHRRGLSAALLHERTNQLKRFFAWLRESGEILSDPAAPLIPPKVPEKLLPAPPSAERLQRFLDGMITVTPIDYRNKAMVELLWGCMLRRSEAVALDVGDIDLIEKTVTVRCGKGSKGRVVPLPLKTGESMKAYLAVRDKLHTKAKPANPNALFLSKNGKRLTANGIQQLFRMLKEQGGFDEFYPHLLRHAGAVHLLRGGADLRHVQELLHHTDLDTTKNYLRLVPTDLKEAYDRCFPVLRV
jgi:site-specific recombinase XerD